MSQQRQQQQPPPPPIHYAVALFPGFQLLDVAGPLDVLNLLSSVPGATPENITLSLVASTPDPVPTKLVGPESGAWTFSSETTSGLNSLFNQYLLPNVTFDSYLTTTTATSTTESSGKKDSPKPIDVLIIPGGIGTRVDRLVPSTSSASSESEPISNVADLRSFISAVAPHVRHSILTVCTGSDVLASTGLLDGRRATTNMSRWNYVVSRHPNVKWMKARRWTKSPPSEAEGDVQGDDLKKDGKSLEFVFDKPIYTSAGISAGIDLMLAFVAENYGGVETAREVARRLEYEWRELKEGEIDSLYDGWDV